MIKKVSLVVLVAFLCVSACYGKSNTFKEIQRIRYEKDTLHTYRHEGSGLEVIWIENKDTNKSFTLGVKTPTTNSTGVNHIIEHTLFTGSKNYPSASLFFDASEAYPSTYMNALTSGDMTIFPFATPYMSCYEELIHIYLDSIFKPNLLEIPYGFYEEGFYYEPNEDRCGGVVYNEMKGAYSTIDRMIYRSIRQMVYKNTSYAFDSGGDPNEIPSLSYEDFVATYKKYYYPANMKIIVYGDLPIQEVLQIVESYLQDDYSCLEGVDLNAAQISNIKMMKSEVLPEGKVGCVIKSFVPKEKLSAVELQALDLWMSTYVLSPYSRFDRALQKVGLGQARWFKDDDLPYPIYSLVVQDIPCEALERASQVLDFLIEDLRRGVFQDSILEKDVLQEAKWIQAVSEENANRGIEVAQSILEGWAHDREEMQYYLKKEALSGLKSLEPQCQSWLTQDAEIYTLILLPKKQEVKDPRTITCLNETEWDKAAQEMHQWQKQKGDLKAIDLNELILRVDLEPKIKEKDGIKEIEIPIGGKIARSQVYYNTNHITQEELPYLFLYAKFLEASSREMRPFKSDIHIKCVAYGADKEYNTYLKCSIVTEEKEKNHGELFLEARRQLLMKDETWYEQKLNQLILGMKESSQNNILATLSNLSMGNEQGPKRYYYEQGHPLYKKCIELLQDKNETWIDQIKEMDAKVYNIEGRVLATAIPTHFTNPYAASWKKVFKEQMTLPISIPSYRWKKYANVSVLNQQSTVDHIYKCYIKEKGDIEGLDYLVATYIAKHHLNPNIRIKLGAYGAGCLVNYPDTLGMFTYRDPNYESSLSVFNTLKALLDEEITQEEIQASKAEALGRIHHQFGLLGTQLEQADFMEYQILLGKNIDDIYHIQEEILDATPELLKQKISEFIEEMQEGSMAIATGKNYTGRQSYTLYRY